MSGWGESEGGQGREGLSGDTQRGRSRAEQAPPHALLASLLAHTHACCLEALTVADVGSVSGR